MKNVQGIKSLAERVHAHLLRMHQSYNASENSSYYDNCRDVRRRKVADRLPLAVVVFTGDSHIVNRPPRPHNVI